MTEERPSKSRPVGAFIVSLIAGIWMLVSGIVLAAGHYGGAQNESIMGEPSGTPSATAPAASRPGSETAPAASRPAGAAPYGGETGTGGGAVGETAVGQTGGGTETGAYHGAGYRWVWSQHRMEQGSVRSETWSWIGLISGIIVIIGSLVMLGVPATARAWGILILIVSAIDLVAGTGGYLAAILGIIGGILGISWGPHVEPAEPQVAA